MVCGGDFDTFCSAKENDLVALGGLNGVKVINLREKKIFTIEGSNIMSLCFVDGILLSGDNIGNICGYEVSTTNHLFSKKVHNGVIAAIMNLETTVAFGGGDGYLAILRKWDLSCKKVLLDQGHTDKITCLAFLEKRNLLVSGSFDKTLRVWNIKTGRCVRVLRGHGDIVTCVSVYENTIISGARNGTIGLWSNSAKIGAVFKGDHDSISSVVRNGNKVFCGSFDRTIKMWDIKEGVCLRAFEGQGWIRSVYFTDKKLTAVNCRGKVLVWSFA